MELPGRHRRMIYRPLLRCTFLMHLPRVGPCLWAPLKKEKKKKKKPRVYVLLISSTSTDHSLAYEWWPSRGRDE